MAPETPDEEPLTYAKAGVDIDQEAGTVHALVKALGHGREGGIQPLDLPGHFAGGVQLGDKALILCTDGVGSKVEIARAMGRYDTVGIDCMAMNVNDAICVGAEPVAFVDYLAVDHHDEAFAQAMGKGLAEAAKQANVAIVGGETATLPGIVEGFDIAGTCLAVADRDQLITGQGIQEGDVILGLPSSGIHSNGLTLARKALERAGLGYGDTVDELAPTTLGEALLTPTKIYVRPVLDLLASVEVQGLVHVTGGGVENYPRVNTGYRYVLDDLPDPPAIFQALQRLGKVETREMYRTFNMGIGFALIVRPDQVEAALDAGAPHGLARIGRIEAGTGVHLPQHDLSFD
ncbi:MAG: phosphoribosylformylglycinamidine cyclo-ligase [Candidatus Thermoplasmatota archaeon]|nr:phosphoribosylformylglycinamidine cyclo-ligase [Candidatus Thermoplasmatota archaeon]